MRKQRGAALMAMLAVLILGAAWWTVTAISKPISRTAEDRAHNAKVLAEAKAGLLGWIAMTAANVGENNPGRLPCPEAPGFQSNHDGTNYIDDDDGVAAGNCTLPAVGRLPWRTLGLDKLRDSSGEPLWYAVSPGWALSNSTTPPLTTVINSNTTGQLTLDGSGNVVALIIAPGRAFNVAAAGGCTARAQLRARQPNIAWDLRDFLECDNATSPADTSFASAGPGGSFNDQGLAVTASELLPVIEAAVADRFERNIAPLFRIVYSGGSWPPDPLLPFAAPFADPTVSDFKGSAASSQGLLPLTYSTNPVTGAACDPSVDGVRGDPVFVAWRVSPPAASPTVTGPTVVPSSVACSSTGALVTCSFRASYLISAPNISVTVGHTANNVGMALRRFDTTVAMGGFDAAGRTAAGLMNNDGSAALSITGTLPEPAPGDIIGDLLCGLLDVVAQLLYNCANYTVTVPIALMADSPLVQDSAAANPQHWFLRNRWHEVSYYAVAPSISPAGAAPRTCVAGTNCLSVSFRNPGNTQRGLIVISGRSMLGIPRPNGNLNDWLEGSNADGNTSFALRDPMLIINRTFNDRIAVIDP
jgi:hypothetical protein